jgi:fibronectin type 3 domain-containing protein
VTDNGVSISWIPSSSRDVREHFLYRREGDAAWQRYTSLAGNSDVYKDTSITRQKQYSYAISAVDDADLESEWSVPATVRIYDQVLRGAIQAFNVSYDPEEKSVSISWEYPEEQNCHFMLYRSYQDNGLAMYASFGPEKRSYVDVDVNKPGSYAYALKAVYPDGGKSALSETGRVEIESE